jgi:excisionase family DNA binding protein
MTGRDRKPLTPAELRSRVVITVAEYAVTFSYDERTVRRAIREGQLQALQVGDTWRIPVAPLLQRCGLADPAEFDLENSDAAADHRGIRSDIRPLKAINRYGHFDPPAV